MPRPGHLWRHVTISTLNSWLPGDRRGWRSKGHKIHSSGDYKNPPPPEEHAGLHRYSKEISGGPVILPRGARGVVALTILAKLHVLDHPILVISVAGMHCHMLVELPDDLRQIRHIIGQCKRVSSHAIRDRLPGRVWAHDGDYKPVRDIPHHRRAYRYILDQADAWTWSFQGGPIIPPC